MGECYSVNFTVNNETGEVKTILKMFDRSMFPIHIDSSCAQQIEDEVSNLNERRILMDYYCNDS